MYTPSKKDSSQIKNVLALYKRANFQSLTGEEALAFSSGFNHLLEMVREFDKLLEEKEIPPELKVSENAD